MQRYVDWLNTKGKAVYTFEDKGVDNSGRYIADDAKVTCDPDFILFKNGKYKGFIEIKHCNPDLPQFHLKVPHVERCIKDDICIVNWMGVGTNAPRFCILTPAMLSELLAAGPVVKFKPWGYKPCLRVMCNNEKIKWQTT